MERKERKHKASGGERGGRNAGRHKCTRVERDDKKRRKNGNVETNVCKTDALRGFSRCISC